MRVGVGDSFSELCAILSGVPQGSVLGPLLFLLFINDLPENIKNKVFLFADDLKMIANALRKDLVDEDLRVLEDWEDTWSLRFNSEKCKTLHLDRNENPSNELYTIHGDILETIESEKDLGLVVSSNFKWDEQIFLLNLVIILHYQCNNNWPLVAGITYFYFNTLVVITIKIEII